MEELIKKIYNRIQKYFLKINKDNFVLKSNLDSSLENSELGQLQVINQFIKLHIKERKTYFINSNYEIISLEKNLERISTNFHQEKFSDLLDKCKILMNTTREEKLYIEKLKEELILITGEKNKIIEKTKEIINDLKNDNLQLIDKIEKSSKDKEKIEKEKLDLMRKVEEIKSKTNENRQLRNEIEKVKSNVSKEATRIETYKDKEINLLKNRLGQQFKLEKEYDEMKKEYFKIQNSNNELKVEVNRSNTVIIVIKWFRAGNK